jgi:hypothetical protein
MVCCDGKEVILKLNRNRMAEGGKLNLVSLEQIDNTLFMVVVRAA